jgi:hypothetical protein
MAARSKLWNRIEKILWRKRERRATAVARELQENAIKLGGTACKARVSLGACMLHERNTFCVPPMMR